MSLSFSPQYILSLCLATGSSYWVYSIRPQAHPVVTFLLVPLFTAYMSILILGTIMPSGPSNSSFGTNLQMFVSDQVYGQINNWEYIQILPPLFAVLLIYLVVIGKIL